jgi:adenylyltransferase/sulfurtransferase
MNTLRYSRQTVLPAMGDAGQEKLAAARVLVVGAGGLGNPAALYLATSGLGHITISDFDTVDVSNLPRQTLYREIDCDKPKAEILALRLHDANPTVTAVGISRRLDRAALTTEVQGADVILDCTDNFRSRWLINEVCYQQQKPLVTGAAIRFEGQLSVFRHDRSNQPCYRCLYSEDDESLDDCAGQGILAPVAGTIGSMMATETIKILLDLESALAGKLWVYDGMAGDSRLLGIKQRDDCPVCS